ncbi:M64 family metallo-endopeptidase [Hahella sp. CR1]|uniref:M64 family metallopeptidase n=1 Tax=Hahella sp. CR1 TaxID=2992807 RepID=UPI002441E605|nr:M64 family metallopeptidase [Hahella sp. CR1]MDG9671524.1 M64 family metallo-endopeptidase [Hahella sp. CR1]
MKALAKLFIPVFLLCSSAFATAESVTELHIQLDRTQVNAANPSDLSAGVNASVKDKIAKQAKFYQDDEIVSDDQLMVIGKDAEGREVYRQAVDNPLLMHAEAFDPDSGQVEIAEEIVKNTGTLRLDVPNRLDIRTLELNAIKKQRSGYQFNLLQRIKLGKKQTAQTAASVSLEARADNGVFSVFKTGDSENRADLVLVSEGYTSSDLSKFEEDARKIVEGYFGEDIYKEYKNHFNVWRVEVPSNQSGAGNGGPIDTKFGAYFNCYNIERLLCVDESKVLNYLKSVMPANAMDKVLVVVNTEKYGGAGGQVATMSLAPQAIDLALHELGHSFAKLADEYDYGTCQVHEPDNANATANSSGAKWRHWMDVDSNVGVFEGAMYCTRGMYRPTQNSMMKELGQPFYAVNESEIVRRIYGRVNVIDAANPAQTDISMGQGESRDFSVTPVDTASHTVKTLWYLNEQQVGEGASFTFNSGKYQEGVYKLKAVAADKTSRVIKDPNKLLIAENTWTITLGDSDSGCKEAPATPTGLASANIGATSFSFTWSAVSGAESYHTEIWNESASKWEALEDTAETTVSVNGLEQGSTQWVRVSAKNACGASTPSEYLAVELTDSQDCTQPPGVPGAFAASDVNDGRFTLSWSAADGAASYAVQKWTGREWRDHKETDATSMEVTASRLGTTEYYRVYAKNQCGSGQATNWIKVVIPQSKGCTNPPAKPAGLQSSYVYSTQFRLTWPKVTGATQYEVQTWDGYARSWKPYQSTQGNYVDFYQLQKGYVYYPRVVAKNACGASTPSNYLTVRLPR